jgi:hypothetical protein
MPYDFKKMNRRSYYPTGQQVSQMTTTSTSGMGIESSRPVTPSGLDASGRPVDVVSVHAVVPENFSETERFGQGVPLPSPVGNGGISEKEFRSQ